MKFPTKFKLSLKVTITWNVFRVFISIIISFKEKFGQRIKCDNNQILLWIQSAFFNE